MAQNLQDLRVRRTRKLIREAFLVLVAEQGFDEVTVGAIADRAMVSRAAFYRHYADKYHLVEQIFEETIDTLRSSIGNFGTEQPPEPWVRFFEHVSEYEQLYRTLLGGKGSAWFAAKLRAYLEEIIRAHAITPERKPIVATQAFNDGFVPAMLAALFVETIGWWLAQEKRYSPPQIAIRCSTLAAIMFREAEIWDSRLRG